MAKKYYVVKNGRKPGIYTSWEECRKQVNGFSNCVYKGFSNMEDAQEYLGHKKTSKSSEQTQQKKTTKKNISVNTFLEDVKKSRIDLGLPPTAAELTVYVDGSYNHAKRVYGWGCIIIPRKGNEFRDIETLKGAGNDRVLAELRNVTGEMLGAMQAMQYAVDHQYRSIEICYDYYGIEYWVTGSWTAKNFATQQYQETMRQMAKKTKLTFRKVEAHTNDICNEMADQIAKQAVAGFVMRTEIFGNS